MDIRNIAEHVKLTHKVSVSPSNQLLARVEFCFQYYVAEMSDELGRKKYYAILQKMSNLHTRCLCRNRISC
jgi:hypothetical protein